MRVQQIVGDWGLEHVERAERPEPEARRGEVVLKMRASSLNSRDLVVLDRGYGARTGTLPLVPLSDGVGEVVAVGDAVDRVALGDRVCPTFFRNWIGGEPDASRLADSLGGPLDGTMCEYMRVPQESVVRVPASLDD